MMILNPATRKLLTPVLALAAAMWSSTAIAAVAVPNASFEDGGGGWPDGWNVGVSGGDAHVGWDTGGVASDGDRSIALRIEDGSSTADTISNVFAVTPGQTLYLYFDYRLELNANTTLSGTPLVQFRFWADAGATNFQGELNVTVPSAVTPGSFFDPNDWLTAMDSTVVPVTAGFADFRISTAIFTPFEGTARFDNIIVSETEIIPAPAALPAGLALLGVVAMRRRRN